MVLDTAKLAFHVFNLFLKLPRTQMQLLILDSQLLLSGLHACTFNQSKA